MLLLDVTLPLEITNQNDGQGHSFWKKHRQRLQYQSDLRVLGHLRKPFDEPVRIVATRILGKNQRLWDSSSVLRGSYKQLEDAMVACGWFVDDGPKYITETVGRQDDTQRSNGPAIRLQVYAVT